MLFRILIAFILIIFLVGASWYFWADLKLLLDQYNIELGGIGSIVTISVAIISLLVWVFRSKKRDDAKIPFIEAKRDVVFGNKKEVHNYRK